MIEYVKEVLIDEQRLKNRVKELGRKITEDYQGKIPVVVGVLKGAMFFAADLIREIRLPIVLDFIAISSYGEATQTSGVVKIIKDLEEDVFDQDVLIVEDIVDTGLTLGYLAEILRLRSPRSIRICALLDKPARRIRNIHIDYLGFQIPDQFVVGYGLDHRDKFRHLPFVCTLKPEAFSSLKEEHA